MYKTVLILALAFVFGTANVAQANKLDEKWTDARKLSNELGDQAKAGNENSFLLLQNLAKGGDATAVHNLGWLYGYDFLDQKADRATACEWYRKGSIYSYPPSMYHYSLCLFEQAKGSEDNDKLETQAYFEMFESAKGGWTAASIYVVEFVLNLPYLDPGEADKMQIVIGYGLRSNPSLAEKVTLSYLKGTAMIYGTSRPDGDYYRTGRDALRFAIENNHPAAEETLPRLYTKWFNAHNRRIAKWSLPSRSGLDCYKNEQATSKDKRFTALICRVFDEAASKELDRINTDTSDLKEGISSAQAYELDLFMAKLEERSASFLADKQKLSDIIDSLPRS